MECTTLELLPDFKHRYKVNANLSGQAMGFSREYRIGSQTIKADAYLIEKIMLGNFILNRVVAFAADYIGEFSSDILIGTNVMNNWKITIDKKENIFQFFENPPNDIPNKKNIYQNFFDSQGNYMLAQIEDKE